MGSKPGLFAEIKRRRVVRTAAVYAAAAFVVVQVADLLLPALLLPEWTFRMVVALLILGFPFAVGLAWSFDLTAEGLRRAGVGDGGAGHEGAGVADAGGIADADTGADADARADSGAVGRAGSPSGAVSNVEAEGAPPKAMAAPPASVPRSKGGPPTRFAGGRSAWLAGGSLTILAVGLAAFHFTSQPADVAERDVPLADATAAVHSIAVLPLRNLAGGEDNEFFADGMTEDILTNLGLVPDFAVTSRTSAMRYKGSPLTVQEIADELSVRYVLEGSLRREGDRVRVVVQLVEPASDRQIWAQTLDRREDDVFALQSEVAQAVVEALRVQLTGGLEDRMGRVPTDDFRAYELFLEGRNAYYRYSPADMAHAIDLFERAIERDPDFALAHAWLGNARAVAVFNYRAESGLLSAAEAAARQAIALQPDLGDGHRALGTALGVAGRFAEAIPSLERAIELNPHDFPAIGNLGLIYSLRGELDRAIEIVLISIRRDPTRSYIDYTNLASYTTRLSLFDRAMEAIDQAQSLAPDNPTVLQILALTEIYRGHVDDALALAARLAGPGADAAALGTSGHILAAAGEAERARTVLEQAYDAAPDALPLDRQPPSVVLAHLTHHAGERARAERLLNEAERLVREALQEGDPTYAYLVALAGIATLRGNADEALGHVEGAVDAGWNDPIGARLDPVLAPLHAHPRFGAAVEEMEARVEAMRARVLERF